MITDIFFFITHKGEITYSAEQLSIRHLQGDLQKLLAEAQRKNIQLQHFPDSATAQSHLLQYQHQLTTDPQPLRTHGGKRPGAGAKKGVSKSETHKHHISLAMTGNKNNSKSSSN